MMHWRASRLIASLPDGTLSQDVEIDVRVHAASCAHCRGMLRDIELAEELLLRMPASILPLEWSPSSYQRLASFARWSPEPPTEPERWRMPILSAVSAIAILAMALMVGRYSPYVGTSSSPIDLAVWSPEITYSQANWH
jgi:hypothetical protein